MGEEKDDLLAVDDRPVDVITTVADTTATLIGNLGVAGSLAEATINLFTGGSIKKKLHDLAWSVSSEINRLDYRVDRLTAEMQEHVFRLMQEAVPVADQEKLRMLRNAMVNTLIGHVEDGWMPALLECVRDLSVQEIRLLNILHTTPDADPPGTVNHELLARLDAFSQSEELIKVMMRRLESRGLIGRGGELIQDGDERARIGMASRTELGVRLFKLINSPSPKR